jgi:excisionase family DNA binding protein
MSDFNPVYLTPEQVAAQLQVVTDTVYRWLRTGKLRGVRVSHKAWRIAPRDLDAFLQRQNVSELLFEDYLRESGLTEPEHEPMVPGKSTRIDYRLVVNGQVLWFEVKQFAAANLPEAGMFDPYVTIRNKVAKAAAQFREYDGECCSLVLYNDTSNLVHIYTPEIVFGAMLGNITIKVPVNPQTGEHTGPATTVFREGGKLIHPHLRTPQNTTFSALIALQKLPVGQREFRISAAQKEADENRPISLQEFHDLYQRDADRHSRTVLRTLVYENPYAAKPLPPDIFTGPYDERWGPVPGQPYIARTHAGTALQQLEDAEHQLELDRSPLQKHIKKRQAHKREGA